MITQETWEAKTTPFGFCILAGRASTVVAERYFDRKPTTTELNELHDNAQLIATAPELLKVCMKTHDLLLCLHVCNQDRQTADDLRNELNQIITKAEKKNS